MVWSGRNRQVLALCMFLLLSTALACGTGSDERDDGRVTLHFWQFWRPDVIQSIIDDFELDHPDIDVVVQQLTWQSGLQKIEAAVAAGTGPDLCELGSTWLPRFADAGVLFDVTDEVAPIRDRYRMWSSVTLNGRAWGLPWVLGTRALFINRTLFRKAGLDPDQPPETWDELLDAAARIDSLGDDRYGFAVNAGERYILYKKFMPFAWGNGGHILSQDHRS